MAWIIRTDYQFSQELQLPCLAGEHSDDWTEEMADNGIEDLFRFVVTEGPFTALEGFSTEISRRPLDEMYGENHSSNFFSYEDPILTYDEGGAQFKLSDDDAEVAPA